jgi:formylglycine-generating enzyme required for sulfatase activity
MVWIPGGTFLMGSDHHYTEEAPAHRVMVDGFWMDQYLGTNAQFIKGRENHPVVHITYEDVEAYAKWIGKEIPTEAEWEFAAWGGRENAEFAWGAELHTKGKMMANTWQGEFPWENLKTDGYERTSPVGSFPTNGYRLYDRHDW